MSKVSVIIPVYNTGSWLRRCLESIAAQTIENIDIICVNDASFDDSPAILHEFAEHDKRFNVINLEEHKGVACARNTALCQASGSYVGFIDSDDYISPHYFESLYLAAAAGEADIAKCNRKTVELDGSVTLMEHNEDICKNKFFFNKGFTTAIYSNSMLKSNGIRFPDGIASHEDVVFLIQAVYWANRVITVNDAWYYCEKRPDSASHRIPFPQRIADYAHTVGMIVDFLNSVEIEQASYVYIVREELRSIYRQGADQEDEKTMEYCLQLFERCIHKEALLATMPPILAQMFKNKDVRGLAGVYRTVNSKKSPPSTMMELLRSNVRTRSQ